MIVQHREDNQDHLETNLRLIYWLFAAGFFTGLSFFAAGLLCYLNRQQVRKTFYESHIKWQAQTFWFALLWSVVGIAVSYYWIGLFILAANCLWVIYRVVKGLVYLKEHMPMYVEPIPDVCLNSTHNNLPQEFALYK